MSATSLVRSRCSVAPKRGQVCFAQRLFHGPNSRNGCRRKNRWGKGDANGEHASPNGRENAEPTIRWNQTPRNQTCCAQCEIDRVFLGNLVSPFFLSSGLASTSSRRVAARSSLRRRTKA